MDIPFITQQNNGVYNDCGPACVAMLAAWLGRSPVVKDIAAQIDTAQDGTTGPDLGRGIGLQGLTPVYVSGALPAVRVYPFIQLVWYPSLPAKAPGYEKYADYHWIVRLDDFRYHDPLFPDNKGAVIVSNGINSPPKSSMPPAQTAPPAPPWQPCPQSAHPTWGAS